MKKFFVVALIGLGMSLSSCIKEADVAKNSVNFDISEVLASGFKVETLTRLSHRFPHRGNEPLEITSEQYTILSKQAQGNGLITTNYGDIPIVFPYVPGLNVSLRKDEYLLTYDEPFFLHGGYLVLDFYLDDGTVLKTDSISFDIIATKDKIDEWYERVMREKRAAKK